MTAKRAAGHPTRASNARTIAGKSSTLSKTKKNLPPPEEWDFRDWKVPENELLECYIHEFSRERIFRDPSLKPDLDGLNSETHWDLYNRLKTSMGAPYLHVLTHPWQSLAVDIKARILTGYKPLTQTRRIPTTFNIARSNSELNVDFHIAKRFHTLGGEDDSSVEYGVFSIDWSFPSTTLKNEFAEWVDRQIKERRDDINRVESEEDRERRGRLKKWGIIDIEQPKRVPLPPVLKRTGKEKTDKLRLRLRALGVCRIRRSIEKVDVAMNEIERRFGLFALPYKSAPDWHRSKRTVEVALSDLFPVSMVAVQKK